MSLKQSIARLAGRRGNKDFRMAWRDDATSSVRLAFQIGNVKASTYFTSDPSLPPVKEVRTYALPGDSFRPEE